MDLSRFASGVGPSRTAPRTALQIGAAGNVFRPCSLPRTRHRGGGNLMVASALRGCASSGPFCLAPTHGSSLAFRIRGKALRCQGNDSLAYVDGPLEGTKDSGESNDEASSSGSDEEKGRVDVDCLREMLQKARKELEVARLNSTMFEEKAQRISESAIALKDRTDSAQRDVSSSVATVQEIISKEVDAKEAVQKATMVLSMAEARLQLAAEALDAKRGSVGPMEVSVDDVEEEALASAQEEIKECRASLSKFEEDLRCIQGKKVELQQEVDRLTEIAERALLDASKAEEDVANIMVLAEQAVALEMEAAQRANDAELALQKAEKAISSVDAMVELSPPAEEQITCEEDHVSEVYDYSSDGIDDISERDEVSNIERLMVGDLAVEGIEHLESSHEMSDEESSDKLLIEPQKEAEPDTDKSKQGKKQEIERRESPKASLKRSSRFFSASFFSSKVDGEFTPTSVFQGLMKSARKHAPKLVVGILLLGAGAFFLNRAEKSSQLFQQQDIATSIEEVTSTAKPIVREIQQIPKRVKKLIELLPHQEVGMSIDPKLLLSNFPAISVILGLLIIGKTLLVTFVGRVFGISTIAAVRVGLMLAPGGEFAFVAFGEAVNQGLLSPKLSSLLFLVVGISMALTPWLAAGGQFLASKFEQHDVRSLLPVESETDDLQGHIIILGFGRVGQIIAQLLSERLIPFVALDVRSDRVAVGRALDLPVYFGDAGSREVLHKVGAERACAAAITLDTPGANYRAVWALSKYFPNVKTFVRAHDVDHGVNLEKAGAAAVVPETLEPSLQLAAAVLAQAKLPMSEIAATINEFRNRHLSELTELCATTGSSLGYGFSRVMSKPKSLTSDDESESINGALAI